MAKSSSPKSKVAAAPNPPMNIQPLNLSSKDRDLVSKKFGALADVFEAQAKLAKLNSQLARAGVVAEW